MQAQFLSTGRIGSENFEKLIAISKDFAATIGIDAGAAGDALSEMFADPVKAADTLYRQYGLINAATARQVTNLAQQNRSPKRKPFSWKRYRTGSPVQPRQHGPWPRMGFRHDIRQQCL